MEEIINKGKEFLDSIKPGMCVALIMDTDSDGLAGARVLDFTLQHLKASPLTVFPGKGEWAFSPDTVERVKQRHPDAVIMVDTGSGSSNPFSFVPSMVIDHHYPLGGVPRDTVFCSSYGREPAETASHLSFLVCKSLVDVSSLEWIALLGVMGDLGDTKYFPELEPVAKKYTKTHLRKAVSLLNAARRSSKCDPVTAYKVLENATSPRDISQGEGPLIKRLHDYKDEVTTELEKAKKSPPKFARENVLLTLDSPCLVHGMVASIWSHRFPRYRVMAANKGYLPGEIVFNFRTLRNDNLITYLKERLEGVDVKGSYGYGHNQATGGRLSIHDFLILLERMEFSKEEYNFFGK